MCVSLQKQYSVVATILTTVAERNYNLRDTLYQIHVFNQNIYIIHI